MNEKATNKTTTPNALVGQILMVDFFPTHRRTLRFAPQATVIPTHSTLTMTSGKRELWYSERDVENMKLERDSDAVTLARTLLTPSAGDLNEGGIHASQVIGLEKAVNPTQAREDKRTVVLHRMAIVRLQDVKNDDELCQISQRLSSGVRLELTHSLKSMLPWMKVRVKETVVYQLARKRAT